MEMEDERDYFKDLTINKFNLLQEWETQSEKSMYWNKKAILAQTELREIELTRKILKATLGQEYRQKIESSGKKTTESIIEELIRTDIRYKEISERLIKVQENADILDAAKWEFLSRKTSLERIQEGIINSLFSIPKDFSEKEKEKEQIRTEIRRRRA
jgi:hypothetical protein